jgi:fumarylacetoacetate (FAA) hydrolase
MKLVTYIPQSNHSSPTTERAGILHSNFVLDIAHLISWASTTDGLHPFNLSAANLPTTLLELLQLGPSGIATLHTAFTSITTMSTADIQAIPSLAWQLHNVTLRTPIPNPPTIRDFMAFEQHVKSAWKRQGIDKIQEWYDFPVFYFSNTAALFGTDEAVPYPRLSQKLDFEFEMAAVIGQEGKDIPAAEAPNYIAGYMIMNDWSARDLQMQEMKVSLGPAKGKDFATSLGPWLLTRDELDDRRVGEGATERFDLAMTARINGETRSNDNFKNIYYSFSQMIERASQHVRLRPGDILGSGTCGTGCILELGPDVQPWLQPGDTVELEIERLGVLRNILQR